MTCLYKSAAIFLNKHLFLIFMEFKLEQYPLELCKNPIHRATTEVRNYCNDILKMYMTCKLKSVHEFMQNEAKAESRISNWFPKMRYLDIDEMTLVQKTKVTNMAELTFMDSTGYLTLNALRKKRYPNFDLSFEEREWKRIINMPLMSKYDICFIYSGVKRYIVEFTKSLDDDPPERPRETVDDLLTLTA